MESPMILCDVADVENLQSYLLSVRALVSLVIGEADSSSRNSLDSVSAGAFGNISTELSGVFYLVDFVLNEAQKTIEKAFRQAVKEDKHNEAEEAHRA